jgi:hypothetical protein
LLPILPEECEVIQIQREGPDHVLGHDVQHLYYVWHHVVQLWLEWLVEHHPAYQHVIISQENLSQLPESGSVQHRLQSIRISEAGDEGDDILGPSNGDETDGAEGGRALFTSGFVPNVDEEQVSELQNLHMAAQAGQGPILMSCIESQPISEWHDNPIASRAFPSLFPSGQADFCSPCQKPVAFSEWASHLMQYEDGRFAKHPRFRYWALNTIMCTQAKKDSSWYLTTHPDERQWTVEQIREMVADAGPDQLRELAKRVSRSGVKLAGTKPFWMAHQNELTAMMYQLHSPHAFITASAADLQWPDLHQHMPQWAESQDVGEQAAYRKRREDLNDNPAIAAYYFVKRWELFVDLVLKKKFQIVDMWWR